MGMTTLSLLIIPAAIIGVLIVGFLAASIRINKEWEESIILRLGKFNRLQKAGLCFAIPAIERVKALDKRIITMDIPTQEAITKDKISVKVDAVVSYQIEDTRKAIINVDDYIYAVR